MFSGATGKFDGNTAGLDTAEALRTYVPASTSRRSTATRARLRLPPAGALRRGVAAEPQARQRFAATVFSLKAKLAGKLDQLGRADAREVAASALAETIRAPTVSRAVGPTPRSDLLLANTCAAVLARFRLGADP